MKWLIPNSLCCRMASTICLHLKLINNITVGFQHDRICDEKNIFSEAKKRKGNMKNQGRDNSMLRYFLGYKNEEKCCLPLQTHKNSIFRQYFTYFRFNNSQ